MTHNPDQGEMVAIPDADFLRDLAARLFKYGAPMFGFDQGDTDRLYALAQRLVTPAQPTKPAQVEQGDSQLDIPLDDLGRIFMGMKRAENWAIDKGIELIARFMDDRRHRLATQSPAAEQDAWEQVGYWKERAEQAERRQQDFNTEHLPNYQKALSDKAELERDLLEKSQAVARYAEAYRDALRKLAIADKALEHYAGFTDSPLIISSVRSDPAKSIGYVARKARAQIRNGGGG